MNGKPYTQKEWNQIIEMVKSGQTYNEIAQKTGRSAVAISSRCRKYKVGVMSFSSHGENNSAQQPIKVEIKPKTLSDFTFREIIKHLYNEGCRIRIRNNTPVIIVEREINLADIIA